MKVSGKGKIKTSNSNKARELFKYIGSPNIIIAQFRMCANGQTPQLNYEVIKQKRTFT